MRCGKEYLIDEKMSCSWPATASCLTLYKNEYPTLDASVVAQEAGAFLAK